MRSEEFLALISEYSKDNETFEKLKKGLPIGQDAAGNITLARKTDSPLYLRNMCVTGVNRTEFIRRFLITVSCLFESQEVNFFILSPRTEYGELLRLKSMDVIVPYIRTKADLERALETVKELTRMHELEKGLPRLVLVLDGLDELPNCNVNGDLEEYRAVYETLARKPYVEIVSGMDLKKSIFSGYPGAIVGVGNCLITIQGDGKADVTYVQEDSSLSMPEPIKFPSEPSVTETVIFFNSLPKNAETELGELDE